MRMIYENMEDYFMSDIMEKKVREMESRVAVPRVSSCAPWRVWGQMATLECSRTQTWNC